MAIRFDKTTVKYLSRASGATGITDVPFAFCAWIYPITKPALSAYYGVFRLDINGYPQATELFNTGGNLKLTTFDGSNETSSTLTLNTGTWYHVALVRESSTVIKLYINGSLDHTGGTNGIAFANGPMYIGAWDSTTDNADMRIAGIKIYNNSLTAAEVAQEYQTLLPKDGSPAILAPCFPGSGERARDYSGNGRNFTENGTLTDEDPPPVSWGGNILWNTVVSAGTTDKSVTDTGSGSDALTSITASVPVADSGAASSETAGLGVALATSDTGAGSDSIGITGNSTNIDVSDSGKATERVGVAKSIEIVATSAMQEGTGTSVAVTLPTHQKDDLLIVWALCRTNTSGNVITIDGSWARIGSEVDVTTSNPDGHLTAFYLRATGSDTTSPTVSFSSPNMWVVCATVFRNVDLNTLLDGTPVTATGSATGMTVTPPTTSVNGSLVLAFFGSNDDNIHAVQTTNSYAALFDGASYNSTQGSDGSFSVGYKYMTTAGSPLACTSNQTQLGADAYSALGFAIRMESGLSSLDVTDTGTAAESLSIESTLEKAVDDSATGSDAVTSITASVPVTDVRSVTETPLPAVSFGLTDTGTGTDTPLPAASVPVTDTGSGTDAVTSITVDVPVTEAGGGSDSVLVASTGDNKYVDDTGTGTDTPAITASFGLTDSGTGTDTPLPAASVPVTDTGSGTDTPAVSSPIDITDTGTGTDALTSITASVPVSESGTTTETPLPAVSFGLTDTGAGTDSVTVSSTGDDKYVTDSGAGSDTITSITASVPVTETGAGSDALTSITAAVSVTDTRSIADAITGVNVSTPVTDGGAGTDALTSISANVPVAEAGSGSDALTSITVILTITDAGSVSELIDVSQGSAKAITDAATGSDAVTSITADISINDSATGQEFATIAVTLGITETASATDLVDNIIAALQVSDVAAGAEIVVSGDTSVKIVKIAMTYSRRAVGFAIAQRSVAFTMVERAIAWTMAERQIGFTGFTSRQITLTLVT